MGFPNQPKMATNSADDLAKELDEKLDKYIENLPKTKYTGGLSPDNWEEEIERIPLFMTKEPTDADIEASPDLAAIQAIKYDDDDDETPEEKVTRLKEDGNTHFQRKHYKSAAKAYTEALKHRCNNADLNKVLYTNRAAANFHLGNFRSSLNDAKDALKLKPDHMKALLRAAQCSLKLQEYAESINWCDEGLKIDASDKKFLDIRVLAVKEKKTLDKDRRKKNAAEKKELAKLEKIMLAIKERNIKFAALPTEDQEESEEILDADKLQEACIMAALTTNHESRSQVELDMEGSLIWPVRFLYPEYSQSDFIEAFSEGARFLDHFQLMFGNDEQVPWDENKVYTVENLEMYFEDIIKRELVRVNPRNTLMKVLQNTRYQVIGNTPTFIVLSKASPFRDVYLDKYAR